MADRAEDKSMIGLRTVRGDSEANRAVAHQAKAGLRGASLHGLIAIFRLCDRLSHLAPPHISLLITRS